MSKNPIIEEHTLDASKEKVWKALTDKDEMKKWYFDLAEFRPEVGFEFSFKGQGHKGEQYVHLCKITEVEPRKKLRHSWKYKDYEGISYVTWELFDEGEKTCVKLTHEGVESFPQDSPDFARSSFEGGWKQIVGTSLKEFAEG